MKKLNRQQALRMKIAMLQDKRCECGSIGRRAMYQKQINELTLQLNNCESKDPDAMCENCDCWKAFRASCG